MILYKKEITSKIAEKTGLKKQDIKQMLIAFGEVVNEELRKDNAIVLKNVFKITPIIKKSRNRYNPLRNKEEYEEEHRSVKMIPSYNLRKAIKE